MRRMHLFGCTNQISCHCEEPSDEAILRKRDCRAFQTRNAKVKLILVFIVVLSVLFNFPSISGSASQEAIDSLTMKLEAWDVSEAWREVNRLLADEPSDPKLLELASHIAFQNGEYQEASK